MGYFAHQWLADISTESEMITAELHSRKSRAISSLRSAMAVLAVMSFLAASQLEAATQQRTDQNPQLILQIGHANRVRALAFAPNGQLLASGGTDKRICLWDVATGHIVRKLEGNPAPVTTVAFSPDGKLLAAGSNNGTTILWDVGSGRKLRRFVAPPRDVDRVIFSRDGRLLAVGGYWGTALWEVTTGKLLDVLPEETSMGRLLQFGTDGRSFLLVRKNQLSILNIALEKISRQFEIDGLDRSRSLIASQDGRWIAIDDWQEGRIRIWDTTKGKAIIEMSVDRLKSGSLADLPMAISPDGRFLVGMRAPVGSPIQIWDVAAGQLLRALPKGSEFPEVLSFSPDGRLLAAAYASPLEDIKLWDVSSGSALLDLKSKIEPARNLFFYEDKKSRGLSLLVGSDKGAVTIWDSKTGRPRRAIYHDAIGAPKFHLGPKRVALIVVSHRDKTDFIDANTGSTVRTIDSSWGHNREWALSPDGSLLATTGSLKSELMQTEVRVSEFSTGRTLYTFVVKAQDLSGLTFSKDNRWLLGSSYNGRSAFIWDLRSGKQKCTLEGANFHLSPDAQWIAYYDYKGEFVLYDLHTGATDTFEGYGTLSFSPGGRYLFTGNGSVLAVWDIATKRRIFYFSNLGSATEWEAFSPDQRFLLAEAAGRSMHFWDIATGRELVPGLSQLASEFGSPAFSSDSHWLAIPCSDGSVQIWDLRAQKLAASLYVMEAGKSWLVTTPDGYFDRSDEAARGLIMWNVGNKLYPVDRFAKQRHRPGLLGQVLAGKELKSRSPASPGQTNMSKH